MINDPPEARTEATHKWFAIATIAVVVALALSVWFAGSAVVPQLTAAWQLTPREQSWMTMSVQLGFVVGALLSAALNLPDRVSTRRLFAGCSAAAALSTWAIAWASEPSTALAGRFVTGFFLAGVYPPGMKLMATWTRKDRGLGLGILVGALTLGSAVPHLLNALPGSDGSGMPDWRWVLWCTGGAAALAGALALTAVREGPYLTATAPFDWRFLPRALGHPPTRLANLGYLGHMWELYAMWAWAPIFLMASYEQAGLEMATARLAGFATIAIGALGCILAGRWADRWGRTLLTTGSLAISGLCTVLAGALFGSPFFATLICLLWGFAVVADSAQFSAAVSELTDERYVGTALTLQTCLGFLLTLVTIRLVPVVVETLGWRLAFLVLTPGPLLGIWSMLRLRRRPEAVRMAQGRR